MVINIEERLTRKPFKLGDGSLAYLRKLRKRGRSVYVCIPRHFLRETGAESAAGLLLRIKDGCLVIAPIKEVQND